MVCLSDTFFGPPARHADTAHSIATIAAQANPDASGSPGV
jgi:hypothetical protein